MNPIKLRPKTVEDLVREQRHAAGEVIDMAICQRQLEKRDQEVFLKAILDETVDRLLVLQGK